MKASRPQNLSPFLRIYVELKAPGQCSTPLHTYVKREFTITSNRLRLLLLSTFFVLHAQLSLASEKSAPMPSSTPPNIILMLADDLGYGEPGCYGNPQGRTPNLDRLAANGARFTSGYAASNVCSPSRAALMTGRYVQRLGPLFEDYFGSPAPGLDPKKDLTLARITKDAGYATGCFGKWNVSHNKVLGRIAPNTFGFDRWVGLHLNHNYYTHRLGVGEDLDLYRDGEPFDRPGVWSDTIFADEAIRFIEENRQQPFFIYLPWQAPHSPLQDPDIPSAPVIGGHKEENRPLVEKMIGRLDLEVGRVLEALERNGLDKNTLIIFTSDNGGSLNVARNTPLRGWKQELWEGGVRVPFIVAWPGVIPAGRTIDTPVTHRDLSATVAALVGARAPAGKEMDGEDLLPLLKGQAQDLAERPLFWRRQIVSGKAEPAIRQSSVRQQDWVYLRTYAPAAKKAPASKNAAAASSSYSEELFNLREDIGEANNLLSAAPDRLNALRAALDSWEKEMATAAAAAARSAPAMHGSK
jgi:arylsulfatase A-like enzyme